MNTVAQVFEFLSTADNWWGPRGIVQRTIEHVQYSVTPTLAAVLIVMPLGLWLGHIRRFGTAAINTGNIGRAIPTFGLMALAQQVWGLAEWPLLGPAVGFVALIALAIPPILINVYTGLAEVPDSVRDAASGMGYRSTTQALRVELPNGLPLVITGLRIAAVQVVATASLLAVFGFGGLGRFVVDGLAQRDFGEMIGGALMLALLVILVEVGFALLQRFVVPPGVRSQRRPAVTA